MSDLESLDKASNLIAQKLQLWQGRVISNSMNPLITVGDILTIKKTPPAGIRLYDIIAFVNNQSKIIVHRVVKIQKKNNKIYYYPQGDSLPEIDKPVEAKQIIGKVITVKGQFRTLSFSSRWHLIFRLWPRILPGRWFLKRVITSRKLERFFNNVKGRF
jgi:signal peptidase I